MDSNTGDQQSRGPDSSEDFASNGSPGGKLRDFPRRLWSLATSPSQYFQQVPGAGGYLNAVLFLTLSTLAIPVVVGVIGAIIGIPIALIVTASSDSGSFGALIGAVGIGILIAIAGLILATFLIALMLFISACVYHLFVLFFAGSERRGFGETFKLLAYASSPAAFVSWIPIVGFSVGSGSSCWRL